MRAKQQINPRRSGAIRRRAARTAPFLTLGLVLDASGFISRSRVLAGNVTESETLEGKLASLGAPRKAVVIMDRGISDDANLAWLRSNGYRYLVVSRDNTRIFDAEETRAIVTASRNRVEVYKEVVTKREEDGTRFTEAHPRCFSEARAEKERGIIRRSMARFESGLQKRHKELAKQRTRKSLDHVQRRVGRLLKKNTRVARYYNVTITPDQEARKAVSATWTFEPGEGLSAIGALLGHRKVTTTVRYVHLAKESVRGSAVRVSGSIAGDLLPGSGRGCRHRLRSDAASLTNCGNGPDGWRFPTGHRVAVRQGMDPRTNPVHGHWRGPPRVERERRSEW